jgi:hypothetical protein
VTESEFFFELLVVLLDGPALVDKSHQFLNRSALREAGEVVFERAVAEFFDEHPGGASVPCARTPAPAAQRHARTSSRRAATFTASHTVGSCNKRSRHTVIASGCTSGSCTGWTAKFGLRYGSHRVHRPCLNVAGHLRDIGLSPFFQLDE